MSTRILFIEFIAAALIFLIVTFFLGRAFCSWACPLGTLTDFVDVGIGKFHKVKVVRSDGRIRNGLNRYVVLAASLFGAATLRYPIFCVVCPIGILCRGSLAGLETFIIPGVAVGLGLWGKRFWCRFLCPVGALMDGVSALSPFIKPTVNAEKCIFKEGCPEDCEEFHKDLCAVCRLTDDKKCERECHADIDLVNGGSLARCTRCLDCYKGCDYDAISITFWDRRVFQPMIRLYNRVRGRAA